jgi:hypothetical protein
MGAFEYFRKRTDAKRKGKKVNGARETNIS